MDKKRLIRKQYFKKRKASYFQINEKFFKPLEIIVKKKKKNTKINISLYYPSSHEADVLQIFKNENFKDCCFLLPVIEKKNSMSFYEWKRGDILRLNEYGIPEPFKSKNLTPDIILVPLLAFDSYKNRIGYGKGYYDKYLKHLQKKKHNFITIGIAFSFQKYNKLPTINNDFKLDYIITEKGIE